MTTDQRKRVALLVEDEFEDADVAGTTDLLRSAGVEVVIVGPLAGRTYRGRKSLEVEADLARRDFTVNAMALRVTGAEGEVPELIDPYGGVDDLAAGVLRTPLAPEESFKDDPLRMLRAARSHVRIRTGILKAVVAIADITPPVVVDVARLISGPAIETRSIRPQRANANVRAPIIQRRNATRCRAGIKVDQTMAVPITHQVAGGCPKTSRVPRVIGGSEQIHVPVGAERQSRYANEQANETNFSAHTCCNP